MEFRTEAVKGIGLALCALVAGCVGTEERQAAEFEAQRAALRAKERVILHDNDGCDMLYLDRKWKATEDDFIASRIGYIGDTRTDTMIYCPISAGFGYFTLKKVGDPLTVTIPYMNTRNAVEEFDRIGKDSLQMSIDYARRHGKEAFLGIRFNDTHDSAHKKLFPPWKERHPEVLFGENAPGKRPPKGSWSAVDFEQPIVRARMLEFMRQFYSQYDVDGVEFDFFRHLHLFKSVAWGAEATPAQLDLLTRFMHELRDLSDEFGRKRGRPILTYIRVPDSVGYCRGIGIDLERWMAENVVDAVIGGGYFQCNPWRETAALVHRYGLKFYVSLDESRIGWFAPYRKMGVIEGRKGLPFFAARMAAAMAEGADGVCFFNCQGSAFHQYASVDPRRTEGISKRYFAVERGSGGAQPQQYLTDGRRFLNGPDLDPAYPHAMQPGEKYAFELVIGDDLESPVAKARPPRPEAQVLVNYLAKEALTLDVNGRHFTEAAFSSDGMTNGLYRFALPLDSLRRGVNAFAVTMPPVPPKSGKPAFIDFMLKLDYPKK